MNKIIKRTIGVIIILIILFILYYTTSAPEEITFINAVTIFIVAILGTSIVVGFIYLMFWCFD